MKIVNSKEIRTRHQNLLNVNCKKPKYNIGLVHIK